MIHLLDLFLDGTFNMKHRKKKPFCVSFSTRDSNTKEMYNVTGFWDYMFVIVIDFTFSEKSGGKSTKESIWWTYWTNSKTFRDNYAFINLKFKLIIIKFLSYRLGFLTFFLSGFHTYLSSYYFHCSVRGSKIFCWHSFVQTVLPRNKRRSAC